MHSMPTSLPTTLAPCAGTTPDTSHLHRCRRALPMTATLYIGLMSGTSADGIDVALVDFDDADQPTLIRSESVDLGPSLTSTIEQVVANANAPIDVVRKLDVDLGKVFAKAALTVVDPGHSIRAIGSHGQTVLHRPELGFSIQLGSGGVIADLTGIDTVNDFRAADLALGGQGAPLVPAFHNSVFTSTSEKRVIVNIGGIANISWLSGKESETFGFDTGPGNTLIDLWCREHTGKAFDDNGSWARSGNVDEALLTRCLDDAYFDLPKPKSTGRELFNASWLKQRLTDLRHTPTPANVQATLVEFTARSIVSAIKAECPEVDAIYLCGGGAHNRYLHERIDSYAKAIKTGVKVSSTQSIGLDPDWVEAIAFAWLAKRHVDGLPGNLPAVTGARRRTVLGNYWSA